MSWNKSSNLSHYSYNRHI